MLWNLGGSRKKHRLQWKTYMGGWEIPINYKLSTYCTGWYGKKTQGSPKSGERRQNELALTEHQVSCKLGMFAISSRLHGFMEPGYGQHPPGAPGAASWLPTAHTPATWSQCPALLSHLSSLDPLFSWLDSNPPCCLSCVIYFLKAIISFLFLSKSHYPPLGPFKAH